MSENEYLDLESLKGIAEPLPDDEPIETEDWYDRDIMPVGHYLSQTRTITGKPNRNRPGHITFEINYEGGLVFVGDDRTPGDNKTYAERYPMRHWFSTVPYNSDNQPGTTSGAAQYLKACGFEVKGMDMDAVIEAVEESQTVPVLVFISREDKSVKQPDGTYKSLKLKLKDFNVGTKEEPRYVPQIVRDGVVIEARPKPSSWKAAA
jgi:hypothetical protein